MMTSAPRSGVIVWYSPSYSVKAGRKAANAKNRKHIQALAAAQLDPAPDYILEKHHDR